MASINTGTNGRGYTTHLPELLQQAATVTVLIVLLGSFSVLSSYFYMLETSGSFNWPRVLTQRIPSYLLWIVFSPLFSMVLRRAFTGSHKIHGVFFLIPALLCIAALHRILALLAGNLLLGTTTITSFWGEIAAQKFLFFSLWFDSIVTATLVFTALYSIEQKKLAAVQAEKRKEAERLLTEAQADVLKNNFHPHFLFNALHGISSVMYKDISTADTMLMRLGNILRYSVTLGDRQYHTLADELKIVHEYLEVQKLRFGNRLNYTITTDDALQEVAVPVFLIQPLAENAIKHGVEKTTQTVTLTLSAQQKANTLVIVSSNTLPMTTHEDTGEGTGITTLTGRLKLLYSGKASFSINTQNHLFTVTIILPLTAANE